MRPAKTLRARVADGRVVLDASAMVDLLVASPLAPAIARRLTGQEIHVPAHFDAEVLSAIGRLERAGLLDAPTSYRCLEQTALAAFERHLIAPLMAGAWLRRSNLRLTDALYVELGAQIGAPVVSTDRGIAAASSIVEPITSG